MEQRIKVNDLEFEILFDAATISKSVQRVANQISKDYQGKDDEVVFLAIMNGAFMFASDLLKACELDSPISFLKLASYEDTASTGSMKKLIGINEKLDGKHVVVIEDIIDSGNTIVHLFKELEEHKTKSVRVAALLMKPKAYKKQHKIDYVGLEAENDFVVGYGLDYNGFGRGFDQIYKLHSNS